MSKRTEFVPEYIKPNFKKEKKHRLFVLQNQIINQKNQFLSLVNTFRLCLSLLPSIRCKNGMNHLRDRVPHMADGLCQYAHQYNNKVLICKVRMLFNTFSPFICFCWVFFFNVLPILC